MSPHDGIILLFQLILSHLVHLPVFESNVGFYSPQGIPLSFLVIVLPFILLDDFLLDLGLSLL